MDGETTASAARIVPNGCQRALGETLVLSSCADLKQLLPDGLPTPFTSADFARLTRLRGRKLSSAIAVLRKSGVIERAGKEKNAYLYRPAP